MKSDNGRIKEFLTLFSKGIETSALYPSDNPIPMEFKQSCWIKLNGYLNDFSQLTVNIFPDSFKVGPIVIYKVTGDDENLAGILHRSGIHLLSFYKKLNKSEWNSFFDYVLEAVVDTRNQVDLVSLLWKCDYKYIDYEAFSDDHISGQPGYQLESKRSRVNYARILEIETSRNSVNLIEMFSPETHESPEAVSTELEKYNSVFQNISEFSPQEQTHIERLMSGEENVSVESRAIDLIFELALTEKELPNFDESIAVINTMLDRMYEEEQFLLLIYFIRKMRESLKILEEENSQTRLEKFKDCYARTGDRIRVSKISNILNRSERTDLDDIQMYLEELDWESLTSLIWMLGELQYFPARRMLIKALANKGKDRIDIIGNAVYDSRWYVVRNAILILGEIRREKGLTYLRKPIEHFDDRVRWETVVAIEKIASQSGYQLLIPRLDDESSRIRRKALNIIAANFYKPAFPAIAEFVASANLGKLDYDELKDWLVTLGIVGGDEAVPMLTKIARKKSLFKSEKNMKQIELAVVALLKTDSAKARQFVNEFSQKKGPLGNFARLSLEKDGTQGNKKDGDIDV